MKATLQKKKALIYLSYMMLYISLFVKDIYEIGDIDGVTRALRFGSYALIMVASINLKLTKNDFAHFGIVLMITLLYGIKTGDWYWSILILFIYNTKKINNRTIYEISYKIIVTGIIIVLACCVLGVLPDVLTSRNTIEDINYNRHSFGFYHSNVLPLLIFYLEVYYICIHKNKTKNSVIMCYMIVASIFGFLCKSRNALISSIILSLFVIFEKRKSRSGHGFLYKIAVIAVPCMSFFSFAMMFLLLKGGIWNTIDNVFSGRFRLAIFKMRRIGIHLVNIMSDDVFLSDNISYVTGKTLDTIVLDNGYLYVMLRYGILVLIFYFTVAYLLASKNKENSCILGAIIAAFVINFVDNDLVDYSFLPFILWAFNDWENNRIIRNAKGKIDEIYEDKQLKI